MTDRTRLDLTKALVAAGIVLYIPANFLPVMTITITGDVEALTILGGVQELADSGLMPVAVLVFFCAMLAPTVYFVGVAYVSLACMARNGLPFALAVLAVVGRVQPWSLVPVFAAACVVSAVKLNLIGTVFWQPGIGWVALLAACALALGSVFDPAAAGRALHGKGGRP